jgi:hypothetical protein
MGAGRSRGSRSQVASFAFKAPRLASCISKKGSGRLQIQPLGAGVALRRVRGSEAKSPFVLTGLRQGPKRHSSTALALPATPTKP